MICITDLETTADNPCSAEIIDGHFIACDYNLSVVSTFDLKCFPFKWSNEAEKIHSISYETASQYRRFRDCYHELLNWLAAYEIKEIWCHSNVRMYGKCTYYDYAVLRSEMLNMGDAPYFAIEAIRPYSTHSLCKILSGKFNFDNRLTLDSVCKTLGIELNHHNAKSDAEACYKIMNKLLPLTTREELYNFDRGVNYDDSEREAFNSSKRNQTKT